MPTALSLKEAAKKLADKYPHLKLLEFSGVKNAATIFCTKHGVKHTYTCYQMIKGCPDCARDKWRCANPKKSSSVYEAEVRKGSKGQFKILGSYINANTKIAHLCTHCDTVVSVTPKSMLQHFGCKNCGYAKGGATGSAYRKVKLGGRYVRVQGSEPEALKFITSVLGANADSITVGSSGKIPGVYYTFYGKRRLYRPDFFMSKYNRLIEVKSTWFFGLTNKSFYDKLVAKPKPVLTKVTIFVC